MKKKLFCILLGCILMFSVLTSNAFAADFNFSFITSSPAYGGVGYSNGDSSYVYVGGDSGNLSTTRYINIWGANNAKGRVTKIDAATSVSNWLLDYTSDYTGNLYLWGNPSTIGASLSGTFSP